LFLRRILCVAFTLAFWMSWMPSRAFDSERLLMLAARQATSAQLQVKALVDAVSTAYSMDDEKRLALLNTFFNRRIFFREDAEAWGQVDYWASPLETLIRGQGDCEDYAIAKYFSLLAAGVDPARLRLVYVRATLGPPAGPQQAHMVLAYYEDPQAEPLILDNLVPEVLPANRRRDLVPVFSFNAQGLWQGTNGAGAGDPLARLSRWREVVSKARDQGFLK
jgi:predicted transglutaminase-like cysteine proteinase